jgi:hypothetical protein
MTADITATLPAATPLGRRYDVARLVADLRSLRERPWRAQRSIGQDGVIGKSAVDWTILSLRSAGGDPDRTDAGGAGLADHADTPHLARTPYFAEIVHGFPAQLLAVRLMALGPDTRVKEHRDAKCGPPWGLVRLHVPIVTNPDALVVIGGTPYHWDAGQLWFGDFNRPHYVSNDGTESRVHLVLDCLLDAELMSLFPVPPDDAILARRPVPPPGDVRCRFDIPARFLEWSEEEPVAPADETRPAEISLDGGKVILAVDGEPRFSLIHLGDDEFRFAGWSQERTLRLADSTVIFTVRCGSAVTETRRPMERV